MKIKTHINTALGYFLIIALLGTLLRLFFVVEIPFNYKNLVHAHSHIALLGWIYTAITSLIYFIYLKDQSVQKKYMTLFWSTQITLIGMLISFPITGYALFSIVFSTLFLIASYWFFWFIMKHTSKEQKNTNSFKLIRAGLWFMVLSSIGPWALGIIMNTLGNTSIWYRNAIYFYLHFQYNGWFIVTLIGVLFFILEKNNIHFSKKNFNQFYWILISSIVLTFFISVLWTKPHIAIHFIAGLGSILQFVAFGLLLKLLQQNRQQLKATFSPFTFSILKTAALLVAIKMIFQFLGAFPYFSSVISVHIDFAIGYLHWTFLGVVSISIFGFLHHFKILRLSKSSFQLYITGFVLMEILIFYKGIVGWLSLDLVNGYYALLTVASAILLIAILLIVSLQYKKSENFNQIKN